MSKHLPEQPFQTLNNSRAVFPFSSPSAQRPGFEPTPVHLQLVVISVALGQGFSPKYLDFPL
jgi:hypothetical protein